MVRRKEGEGGRLSLILNFTREDARRWFCDQEKELFRMRLEEHTEDLPNFLVQHDLKFEEVIFTDLCPVSLVIILTSHFYLLHNLNIACDRL